MWFAFVILLSSAVTPTNGMMGIQAIIPAAVAAGPVGWVVGAALTIASMFIPNAHRPDKPGEHLPAKGP